MEELETVELEIDELESLRLADQLKLYHSKAAERMGISRQTFGLILGRARGKIAESLLEGKAIILESKKE